MFTGANPLWDKERIVFAKTNLNLLPEYAAKVLEHGPWDLHPGGVPEKPLNDPQNAEGDGDGAADDVNDPHSVAEKSPSNAPAEGAPATQAAEELYGDGSTEPNFPDIQPIEYIPSTHPPIAIFEERRAPGGGSYGGRQTKSNTRFAFVGWHKVARVSILAPHSAELVRMQKRKWERRDRYGKTMSTRTRDASAWHAAMKTEWAVVQFEMLDAAEAPPSPVIEKLPAPEPSSHLASDNATGSKGVNELLAEMRLQDATNKVIPHPEGSKGATDEDGVAEKEVTRG